jgi:hypothetical protein
MYRVQTVVPDYWFQLVPVEVRTGVIQFRLAELTGPGLDSRLEGRLIVARWFDGSSHSWIRRQRVLVRGRVLAGSHSKRFGPANLGQNESAHNH